MGGRAEKLLRGGWPAISLVAILVVVASIGSNLGPVDQRHTIEILINVVLVVGLYVFVGNSGVLSFGQMSFMSIGAYATAILTIPVIQKSFLLPSLPGFLGSAELGPVPAALCAGLAAVVFALIIVVPITRLSGLAASLAMFAVLVIVYQVAINWDAVTRGTRTMIGVPVNTTIWSALLWAIVCVLIAFAYQRSSSGLRLRATREDEFAARAAAISIPRERAIAFLISAFVVGIGGFLYAQFQGAFTPAAFYTHVTFLTIAMLVVGGQKSLAGAVVGAVTVSILSFFFNSIEDGFSAGPVHFGGRDGLSDTALAAFILLALLFRRDGIMRGRELQLRWPTWLPGRGGGGSVAAGGAPVTPGTDPQTKEA
ncbi:MAG: branched-chain amino acid ABC transporter permease [Solirubrobacterales bacterium]